MKKPNQKGFGAVEILLILVLVGILSFTGWYVWHSNRTTKATEATPTYTAPTITPKTTEKSTKEAKFLNFKEWQASIKLSSSIMTATYHLVGNTVWLSTSELDKVSSCYNAPASRPTFAGITRYQAADKVNVLDKPKDGDNYMTASQATKVEPAGYMQIGNYVFHFDQGNGQPCSDETVAQENAFSSAFATIDAE